MNIQEQILGAILIDPECLDDIVGELNNDWFSPPYYELCQIMLELYNKNLPIDSVSISQELLKRGSEIPLSLISRLTMDISSSANVSYHVKVLHEKHLNKSLNNICDGTKKELEDNKDIFEVMDGHTKKVMDLDTVDENRCQKVSVVVHESLEHINNIQAGLIKPTKITTGLYKIDELVSLSGGKLITVAARPAMGKSAFASGISQRNSVDHATAMYNLEMSNKQITNRLLSAETGINGMDIVSGKIPKDKITIFSRGAQVVADLKLYVDDTDSINPMQLKSKSRRLKKKHDIQLVVVDYMQLMSAGVKLGNREQEISFISRSLKGLAKELDIPVIALSQLNRAVETRADKRPQLSDLRESGSIEQDSDIVIFLTRPEEYGIPQFSNGESTENMAEVIVAKNREGAIGFDRVRFKKETTQFLNHTLDFS